VSRKDTFAITISERKYELFAVQGQPGQLEPVVSAAFDTLVYLSHNVFLAKSLDAFRLVKLNKNTLDDFLPFTYKKSLVIEDTSIVLYNDTGFAYWTPSMKDPEKNDTASGTAYFFRGAKRRILFVDTLKNKLGRFDFTRGSKNYVETAMGEDTSFFKNKMIIPLWAEHVKKDTTSYSFLKTDFAGNNSAVICLRINNKTIDATLKKTFDKGIKYQKRYTPRINNAAVPTVLIFATNKQDGIKAFLMPGGDCNKKSNDGLELDFTEMLPYGIKDQLLFCKKDNVWQAVYNTVKVAGVCDGGLGNKVSIMDNVDFLNGTLKKKDAISYYYLNSEGALKYCEFNKPVIVKAAAPAKAKHLSAK
jgi:hypothetical protein